MRSRAYRRSAVLYPSKRVRLWNSEPNFRKDFDALKKHILQGNNINGKVRFFLGYSGWEYEQLIQEIKENTWLIAKEEASYLLNGEAKDMWKNTLGKLGSKYETWSRFPQVPSLN